MQSALIIVAIVIGIALASLLSEAHASQQSLLSATSRPRGSRVARDMQTAPTTTAPVTPPPVPTIRPTTPPPVPSASGTGSPTTPAPSQPTAQPTAQPTTTVPTTSQPTTPAPVTPLSPPSTQRPTVNRNNHESKFQLNGAKIVSCQLNGSPWIRSTSRFGGVECSGDKVTVWAMHDLSPGVATSFKNGLSTSQMMALDGVGDSPDKLFFAFNMTITVVVRGQTRTLDIRVGQGQHWPYRNWWIAGPGCNLSSTTLVCKTQTSGTDLLYFKQFVVGQGDSVCTAVEQETYSCQCGRTPRC